MNDSFKPDRNTEAVLVEEMQLMGKRIEDLEMLLKIRGEQIVERFVEIVRADERDRSMRENAYVMAEREACAKVCEDSVEYAGDELARQIRARSNT